MSEELKKISTEAENGMKKAINHLEIELSKIRAGKASPSILEGVNVDYYGAPTPISQIANVQVLDARTISIQPWEKNMLPLIERAIMGANIGITPQNDGVNINLGKSILRYAFKFGVFLLSLILLPIIMLATIWLMFDLLVLSKQFNTMGVILKLADTFKNKKTDDDDDDQEESEISDEFSDSDEA